MFKVIQCAICFLKKKKELTKIASNEEEEKKLSHQIERIQTVT